MEKLLEKLFESVPKVRILRLFMHNPEESFSMEEVVRRTKVKRQIVNKEIGKLAQMGIIRHRIVKSALAPDKRNPVFKKTKIFETRSDFPLFLELRDLVTKSSVASRKKISQQLKAIGGVKLAVISGVFLNSENARTDLLIVGEDVKRSRLDAFLSRMESELGKSIQHTLMDSDEFRYRIDMYDRFLRDILEYPHEKLINRLGI